MSPPLWQPKRILKNSASILGARVILPLASFTLSIAVARLLGPEGLGHFAVIMSLYAIFSLLSGMGLDNLILRDVARQPEHAGEYFSHALVLGLLSSLACSLLMVAASHLLEYPPEIRRHILWLTLIFLPGFVNIVAELLFIALHKAGHAFFLALFREGTMIALSILWLLHGSGLRGVIYALVLSRVAGAVLAVLIFYRLGIRISGRLRPAFLRRLVALIPPFLFINLLSNILLELDIIILSRLIPAPEVGYYMVAKKLVRSSFLLIFSVVTAFFPDISQAFQRTDPRFGHLFQTLWRKILWGSIALAIFVFLVAEWAVLWTYGPAYAPAVSLMRTLAWILIPLSLSFLLSRFLIIGNQQNKDVAALGIAVLVLTTTGIAAALSLGAYGMVLANLLSISLLALCHFGLAKKYLFRPYADRLTKRLTGGPE